MLPKIRILKLFILSIKICIVVLCNEKCLVVGMIYLIHKYMCEYPYIGFIQWEVKQMKAFGDEYLLWVGEMVEWSRAFNFLRSSRCCPRNCSLHSRRVYHTLKGLFIKFSKFNPSSRIPTARAVPYTARYDI